MDNHYRKKNKITSSPDEQVIITDNNSNTSNRHLATASSTISPPKSIKSRTTTPSSTGQQSINSASSVSSNMTTTTGTTSKDTQNIDSNVNNNGQSESNNLSFSSTDSGRSSISSSQTSNGEEVGENSFNTTKVTVLTVSDVDTLNSRSDNDDDDDNNNRNSKSNSDSHNNHNDSSPSASADLDIYSDVTLIPKSTITIDFTLKANKKSTKRVNGRKPIKGIKSIRQTITGTKQNDLKMHEDMSTKCGAETSTPGPYSLLVTKADRLHNLEDKYLQKCSLKSADNQLPSQEDSIPIDHSSGPPQFTEDSQQSIISDSSFILSPNSSSSVLPRSVTQNRHITDKTTKEDPSFQPETQIRNPHTMNHKRTELFTKISDSTSIHKGEHYKVESNSSNIKSPNSSDLSISITSQKDINDLSREINSEISSPLNYNKTIEMIKSNSTSDMFDNFTPITSVTVTTSIVVVNANESLKTGSSISVNSNPRSKLNYYSKDTDHVNNHNFTTNRRKFRNSSNNSNNNNNDFSSFNLKSLLNNKYMKNFLMQPFLMPECMNTTAYTTMNNYELAHLRKSFFNNESSKQNFQTATAAAAALLPDPTVFINSSPYYYWLPSSGFNNTTNNTNTTYTTDCMKLYNDKIITNTNSNNNLNYMHGGNRFILQQFNNHISNGTDDFNSCESLNGNMISTSIPKVSNDEFNHTKQDSNTQSVTSNLSKTSSNPISRSMTKLNSLIPDDVVNRSHFENRPSSAKDLILTDIPSKGNKENPSNTPIYKGYTHNNNDIKISKCQSNAEYLITVDHNSDKLGPNKYGPTESNLEMMVVNMANSLGYPISVITSPMQTDIPQIPIDEIMSIDRNGTASSSSSGMTTTAATNTKGVVNNCIPNPDSYLTAPTTFIYFYNNEGQLFALPSNALIFPTAVGRLGAPGTSNETAYNNPSTLVTSQANGSTNHNNNGSSNGNSSTPLRTNGCVSNYELPDQLYSGIDYSAMLKQADTNHCRELISGYSVPMQPSFLSGFHQWLPGQITVDNQMGSQQLQNSSSNPLVIPPNQGIIIHPSCQFSLPAMGIIQPLLSNVFPNQTLSSTSNSEENGGNQNLSKQKNSQSTIPSVMNRSTEQFKLRRFTNDLPSLLGNAKSSRSGAGSGKLSNSNNNHSKYTSRGLMSSFLDDDNAAINSQNSTSRQKKHASKTNLYIRGLPASFTEEELHTLAPDRKLIRSVKLIAGAEGESKEEMY
ncbi:unnamed protein product [Heterobilharzia americana]|nr:unnamed protein product [Heterobilharzia americana]